MSVLAVAALLILAEAQAPAAAPLTPASGVTLPLARIDESLDVAGEAIKARQIDTRMNIEVRVNGRGPFRFIVDSGADRSVIGLDLARRLALPADRPLRLQTVAGVSRVATVRLETLSIGTTELVDIVVAALPEEFVGAQGLLGIDALEGQRLMLDFAHKKIVVQDARRPEPSSGDEIVVTARRHKGQLILTQLTIKNDTVFAVIDSGAQMTMGNSALRARIFRGRKPPVPQPVTMIGVTGEEIVCDMIVVPEIRVGELTVQNVPVAFADVPPFKLFGLSDEPALLLGTDVLEAFSRVSLDFRRRRVRFVTRR